MEDLEREDGEAVDHEARSLGVLRSGVGWRGREAVQQGLVDLLGEVVAELVEAVNGTLGVGEARVGGERIAGLVFAVPEVEVGAVLVEDELLQRVPGLGRRCGGVMAVRRGEVVEVRDAGCVQHAR